MNEDAYPGYKCLKQYHPHIVQGKVSLLSVIMSTTLFCKSIKKIWIHGFYNKAILWDII